MSVSERKVQFHKFRLAEKNTDYRSFLSQGQLLPFCLSHSVSPDILATVRLVPPKILPHRSVDVPHVAGYGWMEMWVAFYLQLGSYQLFPALRRIVCFSFCMLNYVASIVK